MKKLLGLCAGALLIMPFTLQAEGYSNSGNSATGPSVECHLPDGTKDYMPVVFCQHNNGTYHLWYDWGKASNYTQRRFISLI